MNIANELFHTKYIHMILISKLSIMDQVCLARILTKLFIHNTKQYGHSQEFQ